MRRIAVVNQKGGVGKTTTVVNLGAALARAGKRVVLVDLDPQANMSMHLGVVLEEEVPSVYSVLTGEHRLAEALRDTSTPGLRLAPSNLDLSGAEMELAGALGRETLLRDAVGEWLRAYREPAGDDGADPTDYVLFDCPPSLGLLAINGLAAAEEVFITLQTEFFALQGLSKLVEVVQLLQRRINPELAITGIVPCLYDSRLRLAREVLAEIRKYFPGQVFQRGIGTNIRLAEAPSYGQTIFEYAPESSGARDYAGLAAEVLAQEAGAPEPEAPAPETSEPEAPEPAAAGAPEERIVDLVPIPPRLAAPTAVSSAAAPASSPAERPGEAD